jgi:hypothetical protein
MGLWIGAFGIFVQVVTGAKGYPIVPPEFAISGIQSNYRIIYSDRPVYVPLQSQIHCESSGSFEADRHSIGSMNSAFLVGDVGEVLRAGGLRFFVGFLDGTVSLGSPN